VNETVKAALAFFATEIGRPCGRGEVHRPARRPHPGGTAFGVPRDDTRSTAASALWLVRVSEKGSGTPTTLTCSFALKQEGAQTEALVRDLLMCPRGELHINHTPSVGLIVVNPCSCGARSVSFRQLHRRADLRRHAAERVSAGFNRSVWPNASDRVDRGGPPVTLDGFLRGTEVLGVVFGAGGAGHQRVLIAAEPTGW
jgi:hypothetical protein